MAITKQSIQKLLTLADVKIDGNRPSDVKVNNPKVYSRIIAGGSLAMGEAYMDGWWDSPKLDECFTKILRARLHTKMISPSLIYHIAKAKLTNPQTMSKSKQVAEQHYDLGNDFYESMLDKRMQYTCGYWKKAKNLDQAQEHKLDLVCRKLKLKKGDSVLELGCGWGGFAEFAARKYGCSVTSYNISAEQVKYARNRCKGLNVKIIKSDYRNAKGKFDKVVSIGMCEHVGSKNYKEFFALAHSCLKPGGLFLVHTIGRNTTIRRTVEPWLNKYIFPGSSLPSVSDLSGAAEGLFVVEDWHNFGTDYDKTLMAWFENFDKNWHKFEDKYGERFYRMWKYYLLCCAGSFRSRMNQLWQVVLSRGIEGGYESVR